uniref:protein-serine/threonine phosphatase n=1 Tax=Prolemur simus TaxID=1328070 RepID=A0A8C9AP09_PROSS
MGETWKKKQQKPHGGAAVSWGLRFGASAAQGWRARMEDAHCAWLALPGLPPGWAFFSVFDGHGGARAARFGARHLPRHVLEALGPAPGEPDGVRGGSLAVSRALGDFAYKEAPGRPPELQLVSAEPEVAALARQAEDEFVVLASDGVWDAMSGADLAGLVASRLRLGLAPELLCAQLLDTCLCKGSLDNMTCILVCFPGAPRPSEEAIKRELALDTALGRRVAELCASAQEPPSLNTVFTTLASEDIPDLPPGGGLYCKANVIAEAYSQLYQASKECWEVRTSTRMFLECSRMFLLGAFNPAPLPLLVVGKLKPVRTRDLLDTLIHSHS